LAFASAILLQWRQVFSEFRHDRSAFQPSRRPVEPAKSRAIGVPVPASQSWLRGIRETATARRIDSATRSLVSSGDDD
jgi:hypothetical protein